MKHESNKYKSTRVKFASLNCSIACARIVDKFESIKLPNLRVSNFA